MCYNSISVLILSFYVLFQCINYYQLLRLSIMKHFFGYFFFFNQSEVKDVHKGIIIMMMSLKEGFWNQSQYLHFNDKEQEVV